MNLQDVSGWLGEYEIITIHKDGTKQREQLKNRITNGALDMIRNGWYGDSVNLSIDYLALGTGSNPINDNDTALGNEQYRTSFIKQDKTVTGQLKSTAIVLETEAVFYIREIGIFTADNVMISRILWDRDKTNLESIQFIRTDTIGRG